MPSSSSKLLLIFTTSTAFAGASLLLSEPTRETLPALSQRRSMQEVPGIFGWITQLLSSLFNPSNPLSIIRRPSSGYLHPLMNGWNVPSTEDGHALLRTVGNMNAPLFESSKYYWTAWWSALSSTSEGDSLYMSADSSRELVSELNIGGGVDVDVDMGFFGIGASITGSLDAEFDTTLTSSARHHFSRAYRYIMDAKLVLPRVPSSLQGLLTADAKSTLGLDCGGSTVLSHLLGLEADCTTRGEELQSKYGTLNQACFDFPDSYEFPTQRAGEWERLPTRCVSEGTITLSNHGNVEKCANSCRSSVNCLFFAHSRSFDTCELYPTCESKVQESASDYYLYQLKPCLAYSGWAAHVINFYGPFYHSEGSFGGRFEISQMTETGASSAELTATVKAVADLLKGNADLDYAALEAAFALPGHDSFTSSQVYGGDPAYADTLNGFKLATWASSVTKYPGIIGFKVTPIYELLDEFSDEAAHREKYVALKTAFIMELASKQPSMGCPAQGHVQLPDESFCLPFPPPSPPAPPPVGWFTGDNSIRSFHFANGYCFSVDKLDNEREVRLTSCNVMGVDQSRATFVYNPGDGAIRPLWNQGYCLNARGSLGHTAQIQTYNCVNRTPQDNERFIFNYYDHSIRPQHNMNLCFHAIGGIGEFAPIQLWDCSNRSPSIEEQFVWWPGIGA